MRASIRRGVGRASAALWVFLALSPTFLGLFLAVNRASAQAPSPPPGPSSVEPPAGASAVLADLFVNGQARGSAEFFLDARGRPLLAAKFIREVLSGDAKPEKIAAVAGRDRFIAVEELESIGVRVTFDSAALALRLEVAPGSMKSVDLAPRIPARGPAGGLNLRPEPFSAVLGISAMFDPSYFVAPWGGQASARDSLGLSPSIYVLGLVAEGQAELSYTDAFYLRLDKADVLRDFPALGARLKGGIVNVPAVDFQSSAELLGVAFSRESSLPGGRRSVKPTLQELILDRNAVVSIKVNGIVARRFTLAPGSYRLADLPLASGLNDVRVEIDEDGVAPRLIRLGVPFNAEILNEGELDYSLTLGVDPTDNSMPLAAGYLSAGIGPFLELGADAEAGFGSLLGGVTGTWATPIGNFGTSGSISLPYQEGPAFISGYAGRLSWRFSVPGLRLVPSLGFAAEYRAPGFAPPAVDATLDSVTIVPTWFLSGQLGETLPGKLGSLSLFGDAQLKSSEIAQMSLSAGLSFDLSSSLSISVSGGADWRVDSGLTPQASITIASTPPGRRSLQFRQDLVNQSSGFDIESALDENYRSSISAQGEGFGSTTAAQSLRLAGNTQVGFLELSASGEYGRDPYTAITELGGEFSASTSLALAGGRLAASQTFGNSFAILVPEASLRGERVELKPFNGAAVASAGGEPILVSGLVPYEAFTAGVELPGSAPDRRPDPAAISFTPTYGSITIVHVRAAPSITLRGRLLDGAGKPRANLAGDLLDANGAIKLLSGTFTDEEGIFECYSLGEGVQAIQWGDGSILRFSIAKGEARKTIELGDVRAVMPDAGEEGPK